MVEEHSMTVHPTQENVTMATSAFLTKTLGYCLYTDIILKGRQYSNIKLYPLSNLCGDVILGQNWQAQHESVQIHYDIEYSIEYRSPSFVPVLIISRLQAGGD